MPGICNSGQSQGLGFKEHSLRMMSLKKYERRVNTLGTLNSVFSSYGILCHSGNFSNDTSYE